MVRLPFDYNWIYFSEFPQGLYQLSKTPILPLIIQSYKVGSNLGLKNPCTWLILPIVMYLQSCVPLMTGNHIIHCLWALAISLVFEYVVQRIVLAGSYPSKVKKRPSMYARAFGTRNSSRYDSLAIWFFSALSVPVSNWLQNPRQSSCVPLNLIITS